MKDRTVTLDFAVKQEKRSKTEERKKDERSHSKVRFRFLLSSFSVFFEKSVPAVPMSVEGRRKKNAKKYLYFLKVIFLFRHEKDYIL